MSFIQQFFTSRDNNANAETFVGQEGRLWFDPVTNQIYSSDGSTPGGIPLAGGGGTPGGSNEQVQFNNNGTFGGTANLTINSATGQLSSASFSTAGNVTSGNLIGNTGVSVGGTGGDLTMTGGAITGVGNITSNGIMAINAPGGITTTAGSFDIVNATATTVNLGGSATAVNIGFTTGTVTINNPTVVGTQTSLVLFNTVATTANVFGAATTLNIGATSGTMTLRNPTIVGTQTTVNLWNTTSTTVNAFGAATTIGIGAATGTTTVKNNLTVTGVLTGSSYIKTQTTTVAGLTTAATAGAGARSFVTDADSTAFGNTAVGGSTNSVPVWSDGTVWKIG